MNVCQPRYPARRWVSSDTTLMVRCTFISELPVSLPSPSGEVMAREWLAAVLASTSNLEGGAGPQRDDVPFVGGAVRPSCGCDVTLAPPNAADDNKAVKEDVTWRHSTLSIQRVTGARHQ